jgi:hypothetical protein
MLAVLGSRRRLAMLLTCCTEHASCIKEEAQAGHAAHLLY